MVEAAFYAVVERSAIEKVLAEQAFQRTGCTTNECGVKVGKLLNAGKILLGAYSLLDGSRIVSARIVDVESGRVEAAEREEIRDVREIDAPLEAMIGRLFAAFRDGGAPEPAAGPEAEEPAAAKLAGLEVGVLEFGGKGGRDERLRCRRVVCGVLHAEGVPGVREMERTCVRRFKKNRYGGRVSLECAAKRGRQAGVQWVIAGELLDRETARITVIHPATGTLSFDKTTLTARGELTEATKYVAGLLKRAYAR